MTYPTALEVTRELRGKWHGGYGMVCCPAHKDREPSCSVKDGPSGRPVFNCFAGCEWQDIVSALEKNGVFPAFVPGIGPHRTTPKPAPRDNSHLVKPERVYNSTLRDDPGVQKNRTKALSIWRAAKPIEGTLAERYLNGRGITETAYPCLRFVERLYHYPSESEWPALIVAYLAPDDSFDGIQRIFLAPDGLCKAPLGKTAKLSLGTTLGSAMRFGEITGPSSEEECWRQINTPDGPMTGEWGPVGLCEGPEDAMSIAEMFNTTVFALGGRARLASVVLPPVECLTIFSDNDAIGLKSARDAARAHSKQRNIWVKSPIVPFKDFNEQHHKSEGDHRFTLWNRPQWAHQDMHGTHLTARQFGGVEASPAWERSMVIPNEKYDPADDPLNYNHDEWRPPNGIQG